MLRLGLVGAGRWGQRYIQTILRMSGLQLAHLGSSREMSKALVPPDCRVSSDWREVATDRSLHGIIVATPPATHAEIAELALSNGLATLIEKPMTLSAIEARKIADVAQKENCLVMVGHTHLFSNAFRALRNKASELGRLESIESRGGNFGPHRPDTPMLWDWGPHDFAMCLELAGSYPIGLELIRRETADLPGGTGELKEFKLKFESGLEAAIHISNIDPAKSRYFSAGFEGGTLVYDDLAQDKLQFFATSASAVAIPIGSSFPLDNMLEEFAAGIKSEVSRHESLDLAIAVTDLLEWCDRTALTELTSV